MNNYAFSLPDEVVAQMNQFSKNYGPLLKSVRIANEIPVLQNLADNIKIATEYARAIKMPILTQAEIDNLCAAYNAVAPLLSDSRTQIHAPETAISDVEDEPSNIISENEEETIDISETAISDAIDNVIPIFDEMELPEPQREEIEEYKRTKKIKLSLICDIFGIISAIITITSFFLPNRQLQEIADNQQTQINLDKEQLNIDREQLNISQEQLKCLQMIYQELEKLNGTDTQYAIQEINQLNENIVVSASDFSEIHE